MPALRPRRSPATTTPTANAVGVVVVKEDPPAGAIGRRRGLAD